MTYALITGASSGIGRALASRLIEDHQLTVIAVARRASLLKTLQESYPNQLIPVVADITSSNGLDEILAICRSHSLDYVIHNAGVVEPIASLSALDTEQMRYQYQVNAEVPLLLTNALIPYLKENARVLFVSSGAAFRPIQGMSSYCISKAALEMTYQCFSLEYENQPIHFASVRPGGVDTGIAEKVAQADPAICPSATMVQERRADNTLLTPSFSAKFLAWVLMSTDNHTYAKHWNIGDYSAEGHQFIKASYDKN